MNTTLAVIRFQRVTSEMQPDHILGASAGRAG